MNILSRISQSYDWLFLFTFISINGIILDEEIHKELISLYRKTYVEINLDNLENNVKNIIKHYNDYDYYFGVVKGNCYGHGTKYVINELIANGINYLAVSSLEEALDVRNISIIFRTNRFRIYRCMY